MLYPSAPRSYTDPFPLGWPGRHLTRSEAPGEQDGRVDVEGDDRADAAADAEAFGQALRGERLNGEYVEAEGEAVLVDRPPHPAADAEVEPKPVPAAAPVADEDLWAYVGCRRSAPACPRRTPPSPTSPRTLIPQRSLVHLVIRTSTVGVDGTPYQSLPRSKP